jgi:DNA-binding transcriptional regulator YiaG
MARSKMLQSPAMQSRPTTGRALRELREALEITQDELARACSVHRLTVLRWERRKRLPPRITTTIHGAMDRIRGVE